MPIDLAMQNMMKTTGEQEFAPSSRWALPKPVTSQLPLSTSRLATLSTAPPPPSRPRC